MERRDRSKKCILDNIRLGFKIGLGSEREIRVQNYTRVGAWMAGKEGNIFYKVSELGVRHLIPSEANFHVSYKEVILIHIHNLWGKGRRKSQSM